MCFNLNETNMDEENQDCDVQLKIVVRKNEYYVSKKFICSSVPYFEKMFCGDLLESTENKVELDFDEHVFDSILNWIHTGSFLVQMEDVIALYEAADYLMIDERLFEPCMDYFHNNFTIEHLPIVLSQVKKASKLINAEAIDYFICRHFLKIINTDVFLDYPVATIEHILKLDLMVYSEYQVFESIMKWVNKNADFRKGLLPQLLNCVRWFFMDPVELSKVKDNELIKTLRDFNSIISSKGDCRSNRTKQTFRISIHRIDDLKLLINVYDDDFFCLPIGDFTQDDSMSLEFVHREHISDILFDTGRQGIRIDWIKKTFRWLDFKVAGKTYYTQLSKTIVQFLKPSSSLICHLEEKDTTLFDQFNNDEAALFESVDSYIVIGKTKDYRKLFGLFPVLHRSWFKHFKDNKHTFHATVLDKVVYILTENLEFIQFNYETRSCNKSNPFEGKHLYFRYLLLTSHQAKDNKVILVDKSTGKIHIFCINKQQWIERYEMMNIKFCPDSSNNCSYKLIAFTSTFLQMKNIKPLYKRKFC
ncbi:uncharacterized protein LOC107361336 [Tetranychus urticae]|uniref:uncharacterized protein LOC107361336 n=1 Tax=Tetranychus urticae TaxID=32264 RepID=UPI00077BE48B|nr:uncharacterized protein LOC107361336 [Tetranychus urticae]